MHIWTMARKWTFTQEKIGRYRDHRTGRFAKKEDWERERGREPAPKPVKPVKPPARPVRPKPAPKPEPKLPVKKRKPPVLPPPGLPSPPTEVTAPTPGPPSPPTPVREPVRAPEPVPEPVLEPVPAKPEPEPEVMPIELLGLEDQPFPVEGQLVYRRGSGWIWT
jgi:hypothetical protein